MRFLILVISVSVSMPLLSPERANSSRDCIEAVDAELAALGMGSYSVQRNCVEKTMRPTAASVEFKSKVTDISVIHRRFMRETSGQSIEINNKDFYGNINSKKIILKSCRPFEVRIKIGNSSEVKVDDFTCKTKRHANLALCDRYFPIAFDVKTEVLPGEVEK